MEWIGRVCMRTMLRGRLQRRKSCDLLNRAQVIRHMTGHGLPLNKCEAYNRVYEQPYESR
jgi:hypothetical protein